MNHRAENFIERFEELIDRLEEILISIPQELFPAKQITAEMSPEEYISHLETVMNVLGEARELIKNNSGKRVIHYSPAAYKQSIDGVKSLLNIYLASLENQRL